MHTTAGIQRVDTSGHGSSFFYIFSRRFAPLLSSRNLSSFITNISECDCDLVRCCTTMDYHRLFVVGFPWVVRQEQNVFWNESLRMFPSWRGVFLLRRIFEIFLFSFFFLLRQAWVSSNLEFQILDSDSKLFTFWRKQVLHSHQIPLCLRIMGISA